MRNLADIYVRLSDEDRDKRCTADESESIQNQKSMLVNYCIEQGWQINKILCDEDWSGADRNRPGFKELLKDCEERKIDIVLCKTQSRFSRDMEIVEKYIHGKFLEWDIRFVSIVDHADTNVAGNKKARQINGLINEWYLEDLSDNIKRTLHHKKVKGEFCCPYAPYGYKLDPENKHRFVIDPPAAEVVRSIFEMYRSGMGYIRIAKALNEKRIPPPSEYKKLQGSSYKNPRAENEYKQLWRDSGVYYILRQETYTGAVVQGKTKNISYKNKKRVKLPRAEWIVVPDMHEAIIDKKLWDEVQRMIESRRDGRDKQFSAPVGAEINPLRGMVYCAECGAGMWRMSYQCADRRYKYYRCRTVKNSKGVCDNVSSVRQADIEAYILAELKKLIDSLYEPECIKLSKRQKPQTRLTAVEEERKQLQRQESRIKRDSVQLYRDKLNGLISDEQFVMLNNAFNEELQCCRARAALLEDEIKGLKVIRGSEKTRAEILERYKNIDKLTFELMSELVEGIYVGKLDSGKNERKMEIKWRF